MAWTLGSDRLASAAQAIVQGVEATEIVPGRCEVIDEEQDFGVIVDSAKDPRSLSLLLDSVRKIEPKRIILVTGGEGERHRDQRPLLGEVAHYKVCCCHLIGSAASYPLQAASSSSHYPLEHTVYVNSRSSHHVVASNHSSAI